MSDITVSGRCDMIYKYALDVYSQCFKFRSTQQCTGWSLCFSQFPLTLTVKYDASLMICVPS